MKQMYVLDWQDEIGKHPEMHELLREVINDFEMGQDSFVKLYRDDRWNNDEDENSITLRIFKLLDTLTEDRPEEVLFLCLW